MFFFLISQQDKFNPLDIKLAQSVLSAGDLCQLSAAALERLLRSDQLQLVNEASLFGVRCILFLSSSAPLRLFPTPPFALIPP